MILVQNQSTDDITRICNGIATYKITGLVGVHPEVAGQGKRSFATYEASNLDLTTSRFVTIEIDLAGQHTSDLETNIHSNNDQN